MRDSGGHLTFDPRLPADWPSLRFRMRWQGSRLLVTVTRTELTIAVQAGGDVELSVRGAKHVAREGSVLRVTLHGQGPLLQGRPTVQQWAQTRRDDGSLLTASIPTTPEWEPTDGDLPS